MSFKSNSVLKCAIYKINFVFLGQSHATFCCDTACHRVMQHHDVLRVKVAERKNNLKANHSKNRQLYEHFKVTI